MSREELAQRVRDFLDAESRYTLTRRGGERLRAVNEARERMHDAMMLILDPPQPLPEKKTGVESQGSGV